MHKSCLCRERFPHDLDLSEIQRSEGWVQMPSVEC